MYAAHLVSLEVGEVYHEVIILYVAAHDVVFQVCGVAYRDIYSPLLVHDIYRGYTGEAVLADSLPVVFACGTRAAVCGVALYDCAMHLVEERLDEIGAQVAGLLGLSG